MQSVISAAMWVLAFLGMVSLGLIFGCLSAVVMLVSAVLAVPTMISLAIFIFFDHLWESFKKEDEAALQRLWDETPPFPDSPSSIGDPVPMAEEEEVSVPLNSFPEILENAQTGVLVQGLRRSAGPNPTVDDIETIFFPHYIDTEGYTQRDREMFLSGAEFHSIIRMLLEPVPSHALFHAENSSRIRMLAGVRKRKILLESTEALDRYDNPLIQLTVKEIS